MLPKIRGSAVSHLVVHLGLELDPGLDDIDWGEGTVGDGTTQSTGKSESRTQDISRLYFSACPPLCSPRVEVDTGWEVRSRVLDGLFGILDFVVEFVTLGLGVFGDLLALGNGAVDLVTDRLGEEEVWGREEWVDSWGHDGLSGEVF